MNKIVVFLLVIMFGHSSFGQQVPLNNHYMLNSFVFNPADAGAETSINAYLIRNQRFGSFQGATVNNYLTVDGSLMQEKAGLGFQLAHQTHGIQQQISSSLSYAYSVKFKKRHFLRFGISAGLLDNTIDKAAINVMQEDDPYLLTMRSGVSAFDINAGVSYYYKNLKAGIAVPQIFGNKVGFDKDNSRGYYRLSRHFMGMAQMTFKLGKKFNTTPNVLIRFVPGAPFQYDGTVQFDYMKKVWMSATYKSNYAVQVNLGAQVAKHFKIGYSYEYVIGSINKYSTAIHHEMLIGFTFPNERKTKIVHVKADPVPHDNSRERELEELLRKALAEKLALEKKIDEIPPPKDEVEKVEEEIPVATGYHFIELDLVDSPDGYYVVSGVFGSRDNANKVVESLKGEYPGTYLVINQKNNYYYVVIEYALSQDQAKSVYNKYKQATNKDVWILNYRQFK